MPTVHVRRWWLVVRGYFRKQPDYRPDGHSIAKCERCLHLLRANAGVRLMQHLSDEHKLPENQSIETVAWITMRVYKDKLKKLHE